MAKARLFVGCGEMKKNALRKFLGIYHLIQEDVKEERTETVIQLYGRKKKICIPEWFFKIEDVFQQILSVDENEIVIIVNHFLRLPKN